MNPDHKKILNQMYDTIDSMAKMLNEVSSYNCSGRREMNKSWTELANMVREMNKPHVEITAEMVMRLREQTGEGLMACKKALVASHGYYDKAVEYLRTSGNC